MRPDVVLEARAFVRGELQDVEIGLDLERGTIVAVKKALTGDDRRRFPGKWILPSATDLHVHFRDPGHPQKEDFHTGTKGAALGGVGAVLDMPNTDPVIDRLSRLEEKKERVAGKACVDWGLWSTLTPATTKPVDLVRASAGVKLYLAPTTGIPETGSVEDLRNRIGIASRYGRLVALHAERHGATPPRDLANHDGLRSPEGEVEAIREAAAVAGSARVHVAHATSAEAVAAAKDAGLSVGVTPHHLLLSYDEGNLGARGKVNPPLRSAKRRVALWKAFAAGDVPIVETDHAPHTMDEKARPFPEAPAGIPGVQTYLPLLLHEARKDPSLLAHVVRATCEEPPRLLGIRRGLIEVGASADLIVVDPRTPIKVRGSELASKCGWTPFEGWSALRIDEHFLRGEAIVEDGAFTGRQGRGRPLEVPHVPPRPAPTKAEAAPARRPAA